MNVYILVIVIQNCLILAKKRNRKQPLGEAAMKKATVGLIGALLVIMLTGSAWAHPGLRIDLGGNGFGFSVSDGRSGFSAYSYDNYRPYPYYYGYYSPRPYLGWGGYRGQQHHHHHNYKHWRHHRSNHRHKGYNYGHQRRYKRGDHGHHRGKQQRRNHRQGLWVR